MNSTSTSSCCVTIINDTIRKLENNNQDVTAQNAQMVGNEGFQNPYICMSYVNAVFKQEQEKHLNYVNMNVENVCQLHQNKSQNFIEEPINLSCSGKRNSAEKCTTRIPQMHLNNVRKEIDRPTFMRPLEFRKVPNMFIINNNNRKKSGRKKKHEHNQNSLQDMPASPLPSKSCNSLSIAENKQTEVLNLAKSLFSKRNRTLYHCMYPTVPKTQLKAVVASSWETLGQQEKEFYISEVLGRFGFPQTNLMVNPQIGVLPQMLSLQERSAHPDPDAHQETSTAVSTLLMSENVSSWNTSNQNASVRVSSLPCTKLISRKYSRLGRPPGNKNRKGCKDTTKLINQYSEESNTEEFRDDPELNREFQQFQWTLQLNDSD